MPVHSVTISLWLTARSASKHRSALPILRLPLMNISMPDYSVEEDPTNLGAHILESIFWLY